jgi:ribonuclease HI
MRHSHVIRRFTGAGVSITCQGSEVKAVQLRCGPQAEVYDAEMKALALGMSLAERMAWEHGGITSVLFVVDNQAATCSIMSRGMHPQQYLSIAFLDSAHRFIQGGGSTVSIGWTRSHRGVAGNERADQLAKAAAQATDAAVAAGTVLDSPAGASISSARADAKARVTSDWQASWTPALVTSARPAVGHRPPTRSIAREVAWSSGENRRWSARAMQVRLAHGWFGEYYARIGVPEDDECPCTAWQTAAGDTLIRPIVETWEHILLHCPLYAAARA